MRITINHPTELARNICANIIKELIIHADKYNISPAKFNTLVKANVVLESLPEKRITGYIDISSNTHLEGGSLDYSSFTVGENSLEIYIGFVSYSNSACDDSSWEKIFSSHDETHRNNLVKAMECWAEMFLLHLELNPQRSLLIIDKSELIK